VALRLSIDDEGSNLKSGDGIRGLETRSLEHAGMVKHER
jgi:hypothetical protein